jgi:hypothetical protein
MTFGDGLDDRQPQAAAGFVVLRAAIEAVEDAFALSTGIPGPLSQTSMNGPSAPSAPMRRRPCRRAGYSERRC